MESAQLDLVPGCLSASIVLHDAVVGDSSWPCWTVLTQGLQQHQQRDVALTIVRDSDDFNAFPEGVLGYLRALLEFAKQGRIVSEGGLSFYRAPGPFNLGPFTGIAFTQRVKELELMIPSDSLCGVFLTPEEADAAHRTSLYRVLSRLGQAYRYFPWPYWSDPRRTSIFEPGEADQSILSKVNKHHAMSACATIVGDNMTVAMPRSSGIAIAERLAAREPIAVLPGPDPSVPAALVWRPGQSQPTAITDDTLDVSKLSAWFLVLVPSGEQADTIRFQEDGYCALLCDETSEALVKALRSSSAFAVQGSGFGLSVSISEDGPAG